MNKEDSMLILTNDPVLIINNERKYYLSAFVVIVRNMEKQRFDIDVYCRYDEKSAQMYVPFSRYEHNTMRSGYYSIITEDSVAAMHFEDAIQCDMTIEEIDHVCDIILEYSKKALV